MLAQVWTSELKHPMNALQKFHIEVCQTKNLLLAIEDLGFLTERNWKKNIKKIIEFKPFSCGLVWNNDNTLGGGAFGKSGLTKLGEKVALTLENAGILVDTAHMNEQTFWDFCKITTRPIFNSHSNFYEQNPHARNLKNEQIERIIKSGGMFCLSFVKYFVSDEGDVKCADVARQIAWCVKKFGDKNVGIGSDFFGTTELPDDLKTYVDFAKLKKNLLKFGLSRKQIYNIFYRNLASFVRKNFKKSR